MLEVGADEDDSGGGRGGEEADGDGDSGVEADSGGFGGALDRGFVSQREGP